MANKPFNPLFDRIPTTASPASASSDKSPITGKPMVKLFCGDIPVYVDLESRVVLPMKD